VLEVGDRLRLAVLGPTKPKNVTARGLREGDDTAVVADRALEIQVSIRA
jgi:hypothetical protein